MKIQNPVQYQKYAVTLDAAMKKLNWSQDKVERKLFHGTNMDAVAKITRGIFNRSLSGVNGRYSKYYLLRIKAVFYTKIAIVESYTNAHKHVLVCIFGFRKRTLKRGKH